MLIKGIPFSAPMVRALPHKTQTRRMMKQAYNPIGDEVAWGVFPARESGWIAWFGKPADKGAEFTKWAYAHGFPSPYPVGTLCYVKEAWRTRIGFDSLKPTELPDNAPIYYEADGQHWAADGRYRHARFMPRRFARHWVEVTANRVERLGEISEEDAVAEGIEPLFTVEECATVAGLIGSYPEDHGYKNYLWHGLIGRTITEKQSDAWRHQYSSYTDATGSFSSLWESIYGPDSWERDSEKYVWVIEFTRTEKPSETAEGERR